MTQTTCDPAHNSSTHQNARERNDSALAIVVLIDALGWKYLEGRHFLDDLLPYRSPLQTILGFSSGAIPTILTGELPETTGHWNLFYYDPEHSPFRWMRYVGFLPDRFLDNRYSRKLIQLLGRHLLGLGPLFSCAVSPRFLPWFNWVERRNIYDEHGISGSSSIFDTLAGRGISYRVYTYHQGNDSLLLRRAEHDLGSRAASFFFVYLSQMDEFLHFHCKEPDSIDARLRWYEDKLRSLFGLARKLDPNVSLTVISDHGMTPVTNRYDLHADLRPLGLKMPRDYLAVFDSTMARFWYFNAQAHSAIDAALRKIPCGHILSEGELKTFGVWFDDRRFGETIFLLDAGWLFSHSDFDGVAWSPEGMHGYHPEIDRYSDAIFLSNQRPASTMRTIKDVNACMARAIQALQ